jgi:hypothetical protein
MFAGLIWQTQAIVREANQTLHQSTAQLPAKAFVLIPKQTILATLFGYFCIVRCMVDRQARLSSVVI